MVGSTNSTIFETIGLIVNILSSIGVIGALIALILSYRSFKRDQRIALREATLPYYKTWWGSEPWISGEEISVPELRNAFYKLVGSPNEKPEETPIAKLGILWKAPESEGGKFGLNQISDRINVLVERKEIPEELLPYSDYLRKLTFYYDMIGWLGARRLIDVDSILAPMEHHMRRTWWVAKILVERDRQQRKDRWLDPVRLYGFQWLYKYSEKHNQANIVKQIFIDPNILDEGGQIALMHNIQDDEKNFKDYLRKTGWPIE